MKPCAAINCILRKNIQHHLQVVFLKHIMLRMEILISSYTTETYVCIYHYPELFQNNICFEDSFHSILKYLRDCYSVVGFFLTPSSNLDVLEKHVRL